MLRCHQVGAQGARKAETAAWEEQLPGTAAGHTLPSTLQHLSFSLQSCTSNGSRVQLAANPLLLCCQTPQNSCGNIVQPKTQPETAAGMHTAWLQGSGFVVEG